MARKSSNKSASNKSAKKKSKNKSVPSASKPGSGSQAKTGDTSQDPALIDPRPSSKSPASAARKSQATNFIPEDVSRRMVKRVVLFSGLPTLVGFGSFFANYYILTQTSIELPPYFTFAETLAFFGLGFVGISYGVLSASWDTAPGSRLGFSEFRTNLGNLTQAWQDQAARKSRPPKKKTAPPSDESAPKD